MLWASDDFYKIADREGGPPIDGALQGGFHEAPKKINPPSGKIEPVFRRKRRAISMMLSAVVAVVLLIAVFAGVFLLSKPNAGAPTEIDVRIVEDNPVLQIDHFYPDSVAAKVG